MNELLASIEFEEFLLYSVLGVAAMGVVFYFALIYLIVAIAGWFSRGNRE